MTDHVREKRKANPLAVGHCLGRMIPGDTRESVEAETREVAVIEKEDP